MWSSSSTVSTSSFAPKASCRRPESASNFPASSEPSALPRLSAFSKTSSAMR